MSTVPVSILNIFNGIASVSAPDTDKNAVDGFQALLDIGVNHRGEDASDRQRTPARRQEDKEQLVASYVEAPVAPVHDPVAEIEIRESVDEVVKPRAQEERMLEATDDRKEHPEVAARPEQVKQDTADESNTAKPADAEKTAEAALRASADEPEIADTGVAANSNRPSVPPLYERLNLVLAFLSAALNPHNGEGSEGEQTVEQPVFSPNLQRLQEKLQALPPELLSKLQALVNDLQTVLESDVPVNQLARAGLPSLFGQLTAALAKPDAASNTASLDRLIAKLDGLVAKILPTTQVPSNTGTTPEVSLELQVQLEQLSTLAKTAQAESQVKTAEREISETATVPVQGNVVQKPEVANPTQAHAQAAQRVENNNSNTSFDTNSRGGDTAPGFAFGAPRVAAPTPANHTSGVNFSQLLQRANQQPVVDQVVFHIKNVATTGVSKIHIQLHPAELGKLEIKMNIDGEGKTGITITADNKGTLDLLQRDARGLERALADAGLKADSGSLSFNLRGEQQGQDARDQSQAAINYRQSMPEEEPVSLDALTRSYVVNLAEGLDIKI